MNPGATDHAGVVLVGERGVLIRGASGSGKSSLLLSLIDSDPERNSLVADDRVTITAVNGRVVATAPSEIAGLLEIRGQGIVCRPHVSPVVVDMVVDLAAAETCPRMPEPRHERVDVAGISLPRLMLPTGCADGTLRVLAALRQNL